MARKTVVKRAQPYWPTCERLGTAIQMLNDNGEGIEEIKDITPPMENPHEKLIELTKDRDQVKVLGWLKVDKIEDLTEEQAGAAVIAINNGSQKKVEK